MVNNNENLKDNREKPKHKLNISIESVNGGWLLKEDYYNNEIHSRSLVRLNIISKKILAYFRDDLCALKNVIGGEVLKRKIKNYKDIREKIKSIKVVPVEPVEEKVDKEPEEEEEEPEPDDEEDEEDEEDEDDEEEEMPVERKSIILTPLPKPKLQEVTDRRWLN